MKFGKGILVKLDDGDPESRTVRTAVKTDGSLFLLEISRPIVETPEEAQKTAETCCKVIDNRLVTSILVTPECFNALIQASFTLIQRIASSPEGEEYTAEEEI